MLILQPIVHETVWGGSFLQPFSYSESESIGHLYNIIDSDQFDNKIIRGTYEGKTLHDWFLDNRKKYHLDRFEKLPFLTALVEAADNLSIQVHPDDDSAKALENESFGKNESFYILKTPEMGAMYNGVLTKDKNEFRKAIEQGKTLNYVDKLECKQGDYVYIVGGTLHAATKGTITFEIEENCEHTYRVYDYDRLDSSGKPRQLQVEKALFSLKPELKSKSVPAVGKHIERMYWSEILEEQDEVKNNTEVFFFAILLEGETRVKDLKILPGTAVLLEPGDTLILNKNRTVIVGPVVRR